MYIAGNPLEDDLDVYGRRELTEALYSGPERRVFLVGMRRTGKTSILHALARRALAAGDRVPLYIAPEGSETLAELRTRFANALSRRRALLPGLPGGFLKLREMPLEDLLLVAAEAAEGAGRALMVLVDEADAVATVAEREPAVVNLLRAALPDGANARVLFTGSRNAVRLRTYAYGQAEPMLASFVQRTLSPVLDRASAEALVGLTQRGGVGRVHFSPEEAAWLLDRTGGHPYLTQAACEHARSLGTGPAPALNAVMATYPASNAFQQDLERTSPSERDVMQSIMDGRPLQDWHEPYVRSLVDIGLLGANRLFQVPVVIDFVRRVTWDNLPSRLGDAEVAGDQLAPSPLPAAVKYRTVRKLGDGGFGEVFLMEALSLHGVRRLVAVKLLLPGLERQSGIAARLRDEARLMAMLRHPAIVRAEDVVRMDGRLGLLMEYVPGVDLRDLIDLANRGGLERPPQRVVAAVLAEVADALHVAYNRVPEGASAPFAVLHRDIKPHNIRLTEYGEVKVLDFGVAGARFPDQEHVLGSGGGGTLVYMAPERHRGQNNHPAIDVFALGVTMAQLLTGLRVEDRWPANEGAFQSVLQPTLDWLADQGGGELLDLLERMLDFWPLRRPSAAEVSAEARALVERLEGPELRAWAQRVVPLARQDPALASTHPSGSPPTSPDPEQAGGDFRVLLSLWQHTEQP